MTIQADAVTEVLHKIVEGREDYVYERVNGACRYANADGSPSCIVGHVVALLAPDTFEGVAEYETRNYASLAATALRVDRPGVPALDMEDRTLEALSAAQSVQDGGAPWGYAVMAYDLVMSGDDEFTAVRRAEDAWGEEREDD